jgi:hypothetical protein
MAGKFFHCVFLNEIFLLYSTEGRVILRKHDNFGPVYEDEFEEVGTGSLW